MSRRKQKFPSHIAGEGEAVDCQEEPKTTFSARGEGHSVEENSVIPVVSDTTPPISPIEDDSEVSNLSTTDSGDQMSSVISVVYGDTNKRTSDNVFNELTSGMPSFENNNISNAPFIPKLGDYITNSVYSQPLKLVKMDNGEDLSTSCIEPLVNESCTQSNNINSRPTLTTSQTVTKVSSPFVNGQQPSFCQIENSHSHPCYSNADETNNNAKLTSAKKSFPKSSSIVNSTETNQTSFHICNGLSSNSSSENVKQSNGLIFSDPKTVNTIPKSSDEVNSNANETNRHHPESDNCNKVSKIESSSFVCPVCQENFKSKRSFNSHILIHCQLVKSPNVSNKRGMSDSIYESPARRGSYENSEQNDLNHSYLTKDDLCDPVLPLDLSCKKQDQSGIEHSSSNLCLVSCKGKGSSKCSSLSSLRDVSTPEHHLDQNYCMDQNQSVLSDRSPLEDENENLVNEAREHEKAFFDIAQNEHFLSEDSTGLEPPPPLPLFNSGGITRRMKVCSDEGPPMVYRIKFHAEQIFVSRILGINEETGDKIELYKCFMCSFSFPSVSRLQAHLSLHKQRFVCRKCSFSCDSRIQFSQHVQREHVTKECSRESIRLSNENCEDTSNAENTVTVAALLSALHGNTIDRKNLISEEPEVGGGVGGRNVQEEEEERRSEESFPASPSSEVQMEVGEVSDTGTTGGDIFKMFSCRFCGKKFDRAFSCNRHERVHTGYKPCFCRICGRGFSEPRNLRHHVIRFHSDGSLRHLIKRDRRKKKDEDPPSSSESPSKEVLRECGNKEGLKPVLGNLLVSSRQEYTSTTCSNNFVMTNSNIRSGRNNCVLQEQTNASRTDSMNTYTTNLTKIFAATLDNSSRNKKPEFIAATVNQNNETKPLIATIHEKSPFQISDFSDSMDQLEPGEIRLNLKTKIVDDGERGRRLVVADDQSEEGLDHSPQFSSYAPRLNIVQEPVKRDKALIPITDDIGRTFYECPYCLKFFGSTSDLNRHLDFHEDLRPYDCKYCEYSARTNSQLKVHKMRHEGIKQFSCDVCNYNGVTQSDLNRHKKTQSHIARSQNVCSMCGLGFYSSSQKQVHIAKCHPEMEGASSLIQMSLGIPPSPTPNNLTGPIMTSTSNSPCNDTILESPSVEPSTNIVQYSLREIVVSQASNDSNSLSPRPLTAMSDNDGLEIDVSLGEFSASLPN